MRFGRSGPAILIAAVVVFVAAITAVSYQLTGRLLQTAHDGDYQLMQSVLSDTLKEASDKAFVRAELVTSIPAVRAAFLAHDRPRLLAECQKMYAQQSDKYGLDEAQFHVPPGVSFLRLHAPTKFGDEQATRRHMLAEVLQNNVARSGLDITETGPSFFGVVPIPDEAGKVAGGFEIGFELPAELDTIKESFGIEVAVFLDEKVLRETATGLTGDIVTPKNRVGRYIRFHATNPNLAAALVTDRGIEVASATRFERTFADTPWGVQLVPLYNYGNTQIGVIALATSFGEDQANAHRARVWQTLAALFAIVLLTGVILIVLRGVVLGPVASLAERMAALADGDASKPADPAGTYCEELRGLAASYERLRSERKP